MSDDITHEVTVPARVLGKSGFENEARKVNEGFPNAPLPFRAFHLQTTMKVHYEKELTYEECLGLIEITT